jgi:hypothetical protein
MPETLGLLLLVTQDAAVGTGRDLELEVPTEILLPGLIVGLDPSLSESAHHPLGEVAAEAAVVDEGVPYLGRIEG